MTLLTGEFIINWCNSSYIYLSSLGNLSEFSFSDPPGPPVITGYTNHETIRAGEERILTCRSRGGNPLGSLSWYRENEIIDTTDRQLRGESLNDLRFVVEPKDNGATYTCKVRNKLIVEPLITSVTLNVYCKFIVLLVWKASFNIFHFYFVKFIKDSWILSK